MRLNPKNLQRKLNFVWRAGSHIGVFSWDQGRGVCDLPHA